MAGNNNPEPPADYSDYSAQVGPLVDGLTFGPLDSTSVDSAWVAWVESQAQRASQMAGDSSSDDDHSLSSTD